MIVKAEEIDATKLTEIAINSKSHWGYSLDLIKSWETDLTITSKMIDEFEVYKFLIDKSIVGFYVLSYPKKSVSELEFLFIEQVFIGKGIGKNLLQHAFKIAKKNKTHFMLVLSDPNAEAFYSKFGFVTINKKESSVKNRFLPFMQKDLRKLDEPVPN